MLLFENPLTLLGLFALAVPVLVHLLRRQHHETIDWGAMQFLPQSNALERKRRLDEILLMLLRMAVVALVVIGLAAPVSTSAWLATLADRPSRDTVIVLDGSVSMDLRVANRPTPWEEAVRWLAEHEEAPIVLARKPPVLVAAGRDELAGFTPRGNGDMPAALAAAWLALEKSTATQKEIIVLTDGQRHGWADADTLHRLDNLGKNWHAAAEKMRGEALAVPSLQVVRLGGDLPDRLSNFSLAPLTASHAVALVGREVVFQSALRLDGFAAYAPPRSVQALVDGVEIETLKLPAQADLKAGQVPLRFTHVFKNEGEHLVSLVIDAEPARDALAADNEQHLIVEAVKEVPIVLVAGDEKSTPQGSAFFLERAFARPALAYPLLDGSMFAGKVVLVLADVPRLTPGQIEAIDRFVRQGGGLLIAAGPRLAQEKAFYNDELYRGGQGWLPARLGEIASAKEGVRPEGTSLQHPAFAWLRSVPDGALNQVRFTKWWRVAPAAGDRASTIGKLTGGDPFLVEMPHGKGKVILCTTPLDRSWGSTLPSAVEFPILVHELAHYLAGTTAARRMLRPGEPIVLAGPPHERLTLRTPESAVKMIDAQRWPWTYDDTGAVGVYRVRFASGQAWSFVVPPDPGESDLTRCDAGDWHKVQSRLPIAWQTESAPDGSLAGADGQRQELWWLFLLAVTALLCVEIYLTRHLALADGR